MSYLLQLIQALKNEEKGQALTEYGLIIALVAVALITILGLLAGGIEGTFQSIIDELTP